MGARKFSLCHQEAEAGIRDDPLVIICACSCKERHGEPVSGAIGRDVTMKEGALTCFKTFQETFKGCRSHVYNSVP